MDVFDVSGMLPATGGGFKDLTVNPSDPDDQPKNLSRWLPYLGMWLSLLAAVAQTIVAINELVDLTIGREPGGRRVAMHWGFALMFVVMIILTSKLVHYNYDAAKGDSKVDLSDAKTHPKTLTRWIQYLGMWFAILAGASQSVAALGETADLLFGNTPLWERMLLHMAFALGLYLLVLVLAHFNSSAKKSELEAVQRAAHGIGTTGTVSVRVPKQHTLQHQQQRSPPARRWGSHNGASKRGRRHRQHTHTPSALTRPEYTI